MKKPLWAPWRMEYLTAPREDESTGCLFCRLAKENNDRENLIVYRGKTNFVVLNRFPYNNGHVMIVPYSHGASLLELSDAELSDMTLLSKHSIKAINAAYKPGGFNIGMNIGEAGGAGIKNHLHLHVVPRWTGDTNFMPVIGETKTLPQHLMSTYDLIHNYFKELAQP